MAQTSGPWDGPSYTMDFWSQMFSDVLRNGIIRSPSSTSLSVYADSTGMQVKVMAGRAFHSGQWYKNDAEYVVTSIPTNPSGNPRYDRITLHRDTSTSPGTISIQRVQGTPGNPPPLPSIGDDIPLGIVRVDPGVVTLTPAAVVSILGSSTRYADMRTRVGTNASEVNPPDAGVLAYIVGLGLFVGDGAAWRPIPTGMRIGFGEIGISFNANGLGTLTHGLGWVPTAFLVQPRLNTQLVIVSPFGSPTATTAPLRACYGTNAPYFGTLGNVQWIALG